RALPAEGHSHPPANSAWPRVGEAEFISRRVRLACAAVAKWVPFSAICRRPGLSLAIHRLGEIHCRFLELLIGGVDSHEIHCRMSACVVRDAVPVGSGKGRRTTGLAR